MKICVYCAASPSIDRKYFEATERLARLFAKEGVEVIFGGGATGLMGQLADTMLASGGRIKGIMPRFMNEVEWAHKELDELEFTDTMHERKSRFLEGIDGLVALPGGSGTLEELLEAITLKRLGQYTKPIVILNTGGYYDPLIEMLKRSVDEAFMHPRHLDIWSEVEEPEEVLRAIREAPDWDSNAITFAQNGQAVQPKVN